MPTAAIPDALATGRARLLDAISGVTEEQFKRRPADGGWSIAETLAHLLATERLRAGRIRLAFEQDGAVIEPSDPEAHEAQARAGRIAPVPQLIHGLLASRREIETLLQDAIRAGALDRAVVHPVHGRQTIEHMLTEQVIAHEAEHVASIEGLKAALGIVRQEPPP